MNLEVKGIGVTITDIYNVSESNCKISLSSNAKDRIIACRNLVEKNISEGKIMYGINTGIGEFSETILDDDKLEDFQKYLIYNHAAGMGDPFPINYVRAAMFSRVNIHAKGYDKKSYYKDVKVKVDDVYDKMEAGITMLKNKHLGPWK